VCGPSIIAAWRTNNRATTYLVEHLPAAIWSRQVPGISRLTVGMIAAHIHNSRCSWIRSIGARHGVKVPRLVDLRRVRPKELVLALSRSSKGMIGLIELGIARGGRVPRATWQNFPTDLEHFLAYSCRARGSSSWTAGHGGTSAGAPAPANSRGRCLAVDEARSGVA
jgi:hypothetical protein